MRKSDRHPQHYLNPLISAPLRPMPQAVAVVGCGSIGPDIGYYIKSSLPEIKLVLIDIQQAAVDSALKRLESYTEKGLARGKIRADQAQRIGQGIIGATDYDALAECDWVIEAATENLALKQRIMFEIERRVSTDAIITSNSSSLPPARIFGQMQHPERATITHFFAPAWRNVVVEVIEWSGADPYLAPHLRRVLCETGKLPLESTDVACFMLDRIFDNWCNESALLLDQATATEIDYVAGEYVHAGPFFVLNLAQGNPIIVETNTLQADEEGEHYRPAPIFKSVQRWALSRNPEGPVSDDVAAAIRDRLRGIYFSQAVDIVDRGIGTASDLELGCRLALGFKQGPFELMKQTGDREANRVLHRLDSERSGMPMPLKPVGGYQDFLRHILVDDLDNVKIITLRRPEAFNTLHDEMTDEILSVIRSYEDVSTVSGFVIVGYGVKSFCAGADIGRFPKLLGDSDACAQYARDCSRLLLHLDEMRKPVVAALNGMALGGGLELAMRCHEILAVRGVVMQLPEITLGIAPGIGAMVVPYRRWPNAAQDFHEMLINARKMTVERAHELGVVHGLADDVPTLINLAVARVKALVDREPISLDGAVSIPDFEHTHETEFSIEVTRLIEQCVSRAAEVETLSAALELGYQTFGLSGCTKAAQEGIDAFLQDRQADFRVTG
ncbi:3-hydroxyacyl-CoA dehydrogenase NAD-binding domain-containing protein [Eoetvoesiella caeni]